MAGKSSKQTKAPTLEGGTLRITARRDGFRRCGRAWSAKPVEVSADEFTLEEIQALHNEPMLVIGSAEPEKPGEE